MFIFTTRGLQARRAMLAAAPCWIPRAGCARALFAFHRRMPLTPAISVLTGADKGDCITRHERHKREMQGVRGKEVGRGGTRLAESITAMPWYLRRLGVIVNRLHRTFD